MYDTGNFFYSFEIMPHRQLILETGKSGKLIKIQRKIYSDYECFKSYEKYPRVNQGIGTTQFCAAELNPDDCHVSFSGDMCFVKKI